MAGIALILFCTGSFSRVNYYRKKTFQRGDQLVQRKKVRQLNIQCYNEIFRGNNAIIITFPE